MFAQKEKAVCSWECRAVVFAQDKSAVCSWEYRAVHSLQALLAVLVAETVSTAPLHCASQIAAFRAAQAAEQCGMAGLEGHFGSRAA